MYYRLYQKQLNLKPGMNEAQFSVTTAYQGTSRCNCHIYWWKSTDKIVVSDIDGTITKSDVLGHVMPIIGRDWAQSGVASLFSKVHTYPGQNFIWTEQFPHVSSPIFNQLHRMMRTC